MAGARTITQFLQSLPIPWLVAGPNGAADMAAQGSVYDGQVTLLREAVKARMPLVAPSDALPHIGGDRRLIQGPHETDDNFAIRLHTSWDDWERAGTAIEFLTQLYWGEFYGAVLVQQNGLAYTLSGAPTAGEDPTSLLVTTILNPNPGVFANPSVPIVVTITTGGTLGTMAYTVNVNSGGAGSPITSTADTEYVALLGDTQTRGIFQAGAYVGSSTYTFNRDGTIDIGGGGIDTVTQNTAPWWTMDARDYFCSRFAVLFPGPTFPTSMTTWGIATFDGTSDTESVAWNNPFPTNSYQMILGAPTITDGGPPVTIAIDGTSQTLTGVDVISSAPFTGTVEILAYQDGANPYADFHPTDLARLRTLIARWRPAEKTCDGIFCLAQGRMWGWPIRAWGDGGTWGPSTTVKYEP